MSRFGDRSGGHLLDIALSAFPRRWRATNEAELRHVHDELGGATTVRELVDLVVGGVRVRLADRPPLLSWAKYVLNGTPVAPRWHGWMHDHLTSRWYALTSSVPFVLICSLLFAAPGLVTDGSPGWIFPEYAGALLLGAAAVSPYKQRKSRARISGIIGYDISTDQWRTAIGQAPATSVRWFQPTPTTRMGLDLYGRPVGFWMAAGGLAFIGGAARANDVTRHVGGATFVPDGNSPLTAGQVGLILFATLLAVAGLVAIGHWALMRRSDNLVAHSVHPFKELASKRVFWLITSVLGLLAVGVGLFGLLPDQACAGAGAVMTMTGSLILTADHVARHAGIGRSVSMADLLVGERPVPVPPAPRAEDRVL